MSKEPPDDTPIKGILPILGGIFKKSVDKSTTEELPSSPIKSEPSPSTSPKKFPPAPPQLPKTDSTTSEKEIVPPPHPIINIPMDLTESASTKPLAVNVPFPSLFKPVEAESKIVKPFPSKPSENKPSLPQILVPAKPVPLNPVKIIQAQTPVPLPSDLKDKPSTPAPALPLPIVSSKVNVDLDFNLPEVKIPHLNTPVNLLPNPSISSLETLNKQPAPLTPTPLPIDSPVTETSTSLSDFLPDAKVRTLGSQKVKKVALDPKRKKRVEPPINSNLPADGPKTTVDPLVSELESVKPSHLNPSEKKPFNFWGWPALVTGIVLLIILSISIYLLTRETTLTVNFAIEDMSISDVPAVVYNFDGQVNQVKRDYIERRKPMDERLTIIESDLASAKADLAGREEKKRLLTLEITRLKQTIPALAQEGEEQLNRLWSEEGGNLDKRYTEQKEALHQEIEKRVQELGLKYQRNPDLDAIEVAVNAFRLSLYGAPKTVKVDDQRIFSEDLLKRWKDFEKEWAKQQLTIKDKAMVIKQSPGPKIELAQKSIETLKSDLEALNIDLASLQEEVNRRQEEEVEEQEKLRELEKPFIADLLKIPQNNILRQIPIGADGKITLRKLEKSSDLIPGDYRIFIQAQNQGEVYWAVKTFSLSKYQKNELTIKREDFTILRDLLQ